MARKPELARHDRPEDEFARERRVLVHVGLDARRAGEVDDDVVPQCVRAPGALVHTPDGVSFCNAPKRVCLADDLGGSVRQLAMRKGSALLFTENLIHGTAVWRSSTPRRALNVRYVSPSLAAAPRRLPHWDEMTPLQQALEEPPYENHDSRPRPDIARLIEEEEAMLRENPELARPDHHWQWYEAST